MLRRDLLKALPLAASACVPTQLAATRSPRLLTAICAYSFRKALEDGSLQYEDLVDMAVEHGVDGLDLTVYWFPEENLHRFLGSLRRKAYVNGVELPSIAIRSNLCRQRSADRQREAAWLMHWADIANRLGASHIRVFGGDVPEGATEAEAAQWVAEILRRAADYSGERGVILGLENHGGITARAERIIEIVEAANHPYVGVNLDTGNFRSEPYEQIAQLLPYAVNSQFKVEMHDGEGGKTEADWERIVQMFAKAGYRGYMALEYEAAEDPFQAAPRYLQRLGTLAAKYSG